MKKLLYTFVCICCSFSLQAQVLYGTTLNGGTANGRGTITQFTTATGTLSSVFSFETPDGTHPQFANLAKAADGKLYGMTRYGGTSNYGVLFSYNPVTNTYNKLINFDSTNGAYPSGSLVQATDGKLYGMTTYGGINNAGVIFSFDPVSVTYTKLKDLNITNGEYPYGSMIQSAGGKLYGLMSYGGSQNAGVIFSFDITTATYAKVKDLNGGTGGSPYGSLVQAADGMLYGMTSFGGTKGYGVIFSFNTTTSAYTKLKDFDNENGGNPYGSLVQASDGKLYGLTYGGGYYNKGVIFSFVPATATYVRLKNLDAANGYNPYGSLVQAFDGKLYGTTSDGGSNNAGVIFSFDPSTAAYNNVKNLSGATGSNPQSSLAQASDGKLYAVTTNGGSGDNGVIFSFDVTSALYTRLKDFGANVYGSDAVAGVVQGVAGKLYGMTNTGGSSGGGIIYAYDATSGAVSSLYNFADATGSNPYGSLLPASNGKMYGLTYAGGNGYGVIFSFDPATAAYSKLYAFDYANGGNPAGNLTQAANGKLYGMTYYGGKNGSGVLFSFDPATLQYTKLFDFTGNNGANPFGSLLQAADGKLYGMTTFGGTKGLGVLFSLNIATSTYTKLKEFTGTNGSNPYGSFIQAADGKLYAMTAFGGSSNAGVIISFVPSSSTLAVRKEFTGADGGNPHGSLLQAADGNLYGTTSVGGSYNKGVVFSFATAKSMYTKLQDFDGTNGSNPQYVTLIEPHCVSTAYFRDADRDGFGDAANKIVNCTQPAGYVTDSTDCNDNNASEKPGQTWYVDNDSDGYAGSSVIQCSRPAHGFLLAEITGTTDCNDADAGIHQPVTYYADNDGDRFGEAAHPVQVCSYTPPQGYVADSTDCNDNNNTVYPGAPELCDGIDNNCDGQVDEGCTITKIRVNDVAQTEGNSGTQPMVFTVTLSAVATQTVKVDYTTKNVTATAPSDYTAQNGTLTFTPGVKTQTIAVLINGDVVYEPNETFKIILSNPVNATLGDNTGIGTIINDDPQTGVKASPANVKAGNTPAVIVSPNPATDVLHVQLYGFTGKLDLQLMDVQGKVLRQSALETGTAKYAQQQFNVAGIASGTYLMVVQDSNGNKETEKVMILH